MTRSGLWRKGVSFALILLMFFLAAAISAPAVAADPLPYYTYDVKIFDPTLKQGESASFDLTIGIYWDGATKRPVYTSMETEYICPEDGYLHITVDITPATFTLQIDQTQTVVVTVTAGTQAPVNNYMCRVLAIDLGGGTPVIGVGEHVDACYLNSVVYNADAGCFIATAAYGTSTAAEIDTLRAFRDEVLLQNSLGSQLVTLYYEVSPPLADFISENQPLRTLVKELLVDPVVWVVDAIGILWRN